MKIIRKSNFDHEDHRDDQYFVELVMRGNDGTKPRPLSSTEAEAIAFALNRTCSKYDDDFYDVVPDDYVLPPDWQP